MAQPPQVAERPVVVRGAILMFGLIIVVSTVQRWLGAPADPEKPVPVWLHVIPIVLATSMILQYFAKDRRSPLLLVSLAIVIVSLLLLWAFSAGWLA